jgi:hypothetical protein
MKNKRIFVSISVSIILLLSVPGNDIHAQSGSLNTGYPQAPRLWPEVPLSNSEVLQIEGDSIACEFSSMGLPKSIKHRVSDKSLFSGFRMRISSVNSVFSTDQAKIEKSGYDVYKGYFKRRRSLLSFSNDPVPPKLECYTEIFSSSNIAALYPRLIAGSEPNLTAVSYDFFLSDIDKIIVVSKKQKQEYSTALIKSFRPEKTPNQMIIGYNTDKREGVIIVPIQSSVEVRSWSTEYYEIRKKLEPVIRIDSYKNQFRVTWSVDSLGANQGQTIDCYFFIVPFHGLVDDGLRALDGIYDGSVWAFSYCRYYPFEGFSVSDINVKNGFPSIPQGGFSWFPTRDSDRMMHLRAEYKVSNAQIWKDEQTRQYENFLLKSGEYGLPPYKVLPAYLIDQTSDKSRIYTDFLFAQSGAENILYAMILMPNISDADRGTDLALLQRLKRLYDPADNLSWTIAASDTSYWFEYTNLWKKQGYRPYIVNSHATALRIAVGMERLSRDYGTKNDVDYWTSVVNCGINGLIEYLADTGNWDKSHNGKSMLAYKRHGEAAEHFDYYSFTVKEVTAAFELLQRDYKKQQVMKMLQP